MYLAAMLVNTNVAVKTKVFSNAQFLLKLICFCCKSHQKYFPSVFQDIKHFNVHKFIDFHYLRDWNETLFSAQIFRKYLYNRVLDHITTRALKHQYFRFKIFMTSRANQSLPVISPHRFKGNT